MPAKPKYLHATTRRSPLMEELALMRIEREIGMQVHRKQSLHALASMIPVDDDGDDARHVQRWTVRPDGWFTWSDVKDGCTVFVMIEVEDTSVIKSSKLKLYAQLWDLCQDHGIEVMLMVTDRWGGSRYFPPLCEAWTLGYVHPTARREQ